MAAAVCRQCGAQAPRSTGDGPEILAKRCRFCGQAYGTVAVAAPPPAAAEGRPVLAQAPPRHRQPPDAAAFGRPAAADSAWRGAAADPLSQPFDVEIAADAVATVPARRRRLPILLALGLAATLAAAVVRPVQMGLSPDWLQALVGKRVDPAAQKALQQGLVALDRGSSRSLVEAKHSFEQALKVDPHFAPALAGLAETELAMAQALTDAAQDTAHYAQSLGRKDMRRAQHDAQTQRLEAKAWSAAATPAAQLAVQLAPNTAAANRSMAELLRQRADVKGAIAWSEAGQKSVVDDAGMLVVRADLLGQQDLSGACALLRRSLEQAPTNNRARLKLAQGLLRKKDALHALAAVQDILAAAPEHELAQQLRLRLQPAHSPTDRWQRPIVLSFAAELPAEQASVALAAAPDDADLPAEAAGRAAPEAAAGDSAAPQDDDAASSLGPPLTFFAQAKVSLRNIWQGLTAVLSGNNEVPAPVAPSDLGGGMPVLSAPAAAPGQRAAAALPAPGPGTVAAKRPPAGPLVGLAAGAVARGAPSGAVVLPQDGPGRAAVAIEALASKAAAATPAGPVPAELQRLDAAQLLQQADALLAQQHADRALPVYQLAAKRAPQQMAGLLGIGYAQLAMGEAKGAAEAFGEALRRSSWQAEPHFGLARALQDLGQGREAVGHYRRYLAIEPNGPRAAQARQKLEELSK